jgi:hypothetical protein
MMALTSHTGARRSTWGGWRRNNMTDELKNQERPVMGRGGGGSIGCTRVLVHTVHVQYLLTLQYMLHTIAPYRYIVDNWYTYVC